MSEKAEPKFKSMAENMGSDIDNFYEFESPVINIPLGGGLPSGKVVEVYGWESVGKSTILLEFARVFEKFFKKQGRTDYKVLWIECESSFDKLRAKWMGCDIEYWFGEDELDTVEAIQQKIIDFLSYAEQENFYPLIAIDTIAAVTTEAEKKEKYAGGYADRPKAMKEFFRQVNHLIGKTQATLLIANQLNKSLTPGKEDESPIPAIKFHAHIRIKAQREADVSDKNNPAEKDKSVYGILTNFYFKKNKITQPRQGVRMLISNESGFLFLNSEIDFLVMHQVITPGTWKKIEFPDKPYHESGKQPQMVKQKFQNAEKIQELIEAKYPHLWHWLHYQIYKTKINRSTFLKMRLIDQVQAYEEYFFGETYQTLTEKEKQAADAVLNGLEAEG